MQRLLTYLHQTQYVRAVQSALSYHLTDGERVCIALLSKPYTLIFSASNRGYKKTPTSVTAPGFVACLPGKLHDTIDGKSGNWTSPAQWFCVFSSPKLEIWERHGRLPYLPIRAGLTTEERAVVLSKARQALNETLLTGTPAAITPPDTDPRWQELTSLDVAVWVDGKLRASMIEYNQPFSTALSKAVARATHDNRFKPLELDELLRITIEVTIFSDVVVPLTAEEKRPGAALYYHLGYVLQQGPHRAVYLPAVHNCLAFKNDASRFIESLGTKKAGLPLSGVANATVSVFAVQDFVEQPNRQPLGLYGPVSSPIDLPATLPTIKTAAEAACDNLLANQEESGYIHGIQPLYTQPSAHNHWARLAFAGYALALWGITARDEAALAGAQKILAYITQHEEHLDLNRPSHAAVINYLGQLAVALGNKSSTKRYVDILLSYGESLPYEPILYSQTALFLVASRDARTEATQLTATLATKVGRAFAAGVRNNEPLSLASYPELLDNKLEQLFTEKDLLSSAEVLAWYKKLQRADGAFPDTPHSTFTYTRGTGKIFEVLASTDASEATAAAAQWLLTHQYTVNNLYFVPPQAHRGFLGGFRHDYGNPDAHIDATAHFLIGAARLLQKSPTPEEDIHKKQIAGGHRWVG